MSLERVAHRAVADLDQSKHATVEQASRAQHATHGGRNRRLLIGEALPLLLSERDFRVRVLGYGETKFRALRNAGTYVHLEATLPGERLRMYSGRKIDRWLAEQRADADAPLSLTVGNAPKRNGRQFFGAARRHADSVAKGR